MMVMPIKMVKNFFFFFQHSVNDENAFNGEDFTKDLMTRDCDWVEWGLNYSNRKCLHTYQLPIS